MGEGEKQKGQKGREEEQAQRKIKEERQGDSGDTK